MANVEEKSAKRKSKSRRSKSSSLNVRLLNKSIPIFTDEFLQLYSKQKCEIRSLKLRLNHLNEQLKYKDAQQEQIRLDKKKMRRDFEEISSENLFLENQIEKFENEFLQQFHFPSKENLFESIELCFQNDQNQCEKKIFQLVSRLEI